MKASETVVTPFARLALGFSFLSAVADRFGLWGALGAPHIAWGDFAHFITYTATLNWFLPRPMIPALACNRRRGYPRYRFNSGCLYPYYGLPQRSFAIAVRLGHGHRFGVKRPARRVRLFGFRGCISSGNRRKISIQH